MASGSRHPDHASVCRCVVTIHEERVLIECPPFLERGNDQFNEHRSRAASAHIRVCNQPGKMTTTVAFVALTKRGQLSVGIAQRVSLRGVHAAILDKRLMREREAKIGTAPGVDRPGIGKPRHQDVNIAGLRCG